MPKMGHTNMGNIYWIVDDIVMKYKVIIEHK